MLESTLEVNDLHKKIVELFSKLRALVDLIDFDSQDIKDIIEGIVAKELLYFSSYAQIVKLVETAYYIQLPYKSFWQGV